MMPGGMPSGVPSSVCLPPADTMHRQYANRIPVRMPGGKPSGVPPSVYLTSVDAQNQQYMSGGMTTIPEGMPMGIPASVYRTPMDALNHQQVDRDIVSSVNGNAMQYSEFQSGPELFPPVGSVYCAAPNTAASVNTHMYRESAMSFSQCVA